MSTIAIVVAESEAALDACAEAGGLAVIPGTKQRFDALCTYRSPAMADAGDIDVPGQGWVALAEAD